MIKRIKQVVFLISLFWLFALEVSAASLSIWASASNVTVGQNVTISVKVEDLGGEFKVTSSDQSVLAGGVNSKWLEGDTYTFSFTAKKVGKATITVTPIDAATTGEEVFTTSKSVTLNVVAKNQASSGSSGKPSGGTTANKKEYSSDNNLKSLRIDGYEFEPVFNKDVVEYRLTVDQSVEKINVSGEVNDSKARVNGLGEKSLANGENTIEIKVTAENGNEKVYKLIVTVSDLNPIKVNVGKDEFTIVKKNNDLIDKLDYYEEIYLTVDEQEVVAYHNNNTNVTLVLLKNSDNEINYYIYNVKNNTYIKYRYVTVGNVTLQLLDAPDKLEKYNKYTLELQNQKIDYYKIKGSHKVGLLYGTNVSTGNTGYYVYDKNEETLCKYYNEEVKVYKTENKQLKTYMMFLIGGVSFVSIVLIGVSLKNNKNNKRSKYKI